MIVPPRIVNELSWVGNYWPSDIPTEDVQFVRPEVQRYCLMGAAGSYTDFHVDFGGSSVWYHVLRVWSLNIVSECVLLWLYVKSSNKTFLFFIVASSIFCYNNIVVLYQRYIV